MTVVSFCPHQDLLGVMCPDCVTLIGVALGTLEHSVVREIAALADSYALNIMNDLPTVESEEALRDGLAGALLSFMAEAILLAHQHQADVSHSLRT